MIVKIIKSYRDTDLELALIPSSRNNTEVLVNVSDERAEQLIEAGVAEKYMFIESKEEAINVLEAEPTIEVEEVKTEETVKIEETAKESEIAEETAEEVVAEETKKTNTKKNSK